MSRLTLSLFVLLGFVFATFLGLAPLAGLGWRIPDSTFWCLVLGGLGATAGCSRWYTRGRHGFFSGLARVVTNATPETVVLVGFLLALVIWTYWLLLAASLVQGRDWAGRSWDGVVEALSEA